MSHISVNIGSLFNNVDDLVSKLPRDRAMLEVLEETGLLAKNLFTINETYTKAPTKVSRKSLDGFYPTRLSLLYLKPPRGDKQ